MKKYISILFTIMVTSICVFSQGNNEKLYQAINKNDTSLVKQLLNDKADPNFVKSQGWMKVNMLITAVNNGNIDIIKMLIAQGVDIKWRDGFNTSALMYAAAKGNKEVVILLLDNGADVNDKDGQGNTVLSAAKESKNKDLVKFIESKLNTQK